MNSDNSELKDAWANSPYPSLKIQSYFPVYAELFRSLRNQSCTFVETGVLGGGSLFMWREWLGKSARIIGVDLNPESKKWAQHGFEIFIGDQGDPYFWAKTLKEIGHVDVLLDDGGHQSFQQIVTLNSFLQYSKNKCMVVIEDAHTSYMSDFNAHGEHSFMAYAKECAGFLTARGASMYPRRMPEVTNHASLNLLKAVQSIEFFDSIIAFKINPEFAMEQNASVSNNKGQFPRDFRYEGVNSAKVQWPNPYRDDRVIIKGGKV